MGLNASEIYDWTAAVLASMRCALDDEGFLEMLPAVLSARFEPGARHAIAVLGEQALPDIQTNGRYASQPDVTVSGSRYYFLPVSHCVEKQLACEFAERVYCVAPCIRLLMDGENRSGRHLYTFFQIEVEWRTQEVEQVYATVESLLRIFVETLSSRLDRYGLLDRDVVERLAALASGPFARLPFAAARRRSAHVGGNANPHVDGDLTHAQEDWLSREATAPFWLTDYPDGVRDSLYRRKPDGAFATYDLILPEGHGELATGGLRPDSGEDIRRQARTFATDPHPYYSEWKARTQVQTGGIGFGLERLVRYCAGADSVLDLVAPHDHGPNATVGR